MYGLLIAVRSTKVFIGQLSEAVMYGSFIGLVIYAIYYIFKNWKKKK
ncbi:MAG: hypothetical protein ACRDBO_12265 [Lachnospiraceae bacterium]